MPELPPGFDASLSVDAVVRSLAGRRVFFDAMSGNNGDRLIHMGAELALAALDTSTDPEQAEVIIINGGGGMIDESKGGIGTLRAHLARSPEREIIVFPQSYKFEHVDFGALFDGRQAPVTLFARERYSLDVLAGVTLPACVRVGLDHDLAFRLGDGELVGRLRAAATNKHILIVERADAEATTGAHQAPIGPKGIKRLVPDALKKPLKRAIYRRRARAWSANSPYVQKMRDHLVQRDASWANLPVVSMDISDQGVIDFDGFCDAIADAACVATNRLHVGVLAAMVGKPTVLASNSYHKIRGIAEHSMADMPHVEFLGW